MPSIWKRRSQPKAEPYNFPIAEELKDVDPLPVQEDADELEESSDTSELPLEREVEEKPEPQMDYASVQAEQILQEAQLKADALLASAEAQAAEMAEAAREEGFQQGFAQGSAQGLEQSLAEQRQLQAQQAEELAEEVGQFLARANVILERQMDENIGELRDLAIAVAEKVIGISLESSSEVIERMIRMAVDKRKRREWVQIYVTERDARRLVRVSPMLSGALSALSDRVRIIPVSDDEAGVCIIEMPDQIIDASVSTQLDNLRSTLSETPPDTPSGTLDIEGNV